MGRPKEFLPFGSETLLARVIRIVASRSTVVVVSAAVGQRLPPIPDGIAVEVVRDPEPDRGPLQGLAVGLATLSGRVDWAFACASDAPMIEPAWIDRLLDCEDAELDLILPRIAGRDQPLAAIYRTGPAALEADRLLASGQSRLSLLADRLRTRRLSEASFLEVDPEFRTLRNLNTPGEYQSLIEDMEPSDPEPWTEHHNES